MVKGLKILYNKIMTKNFFKIQIHQIHQIHQNQY